MLGDSSGVMYMWEPEVSLGYHSREVVFLDLFETESLIVRLAGCLHLASIVITSTGAWFGCCWFSKSHSSLHAFIAITNPTEIFPGPLNSQIFVKCQHIKSPITRDCFLIKFGENVVHTIFFCFVIKL